MKKPIRAVLFDLDDTLLVNDMDRFLKAYFGLLTPLVANLVPPHKFISALYHATSAILDNKDPEVTNQQAFSNDFFPRVGRTPEEMIPIFDHFYAEEFGKLRSLTSPDPSARSAIQATLDAGCEVVIATNPVFPDTAIRQRIEWAGVLDFPFRLITSYELMHAAKPSCRYYSEILEYIGRSPHECLMVGNDWVNDIEPAVKTGLQVFWVNAGTSSISEIDSFSRGTLTEFKERFSYLYRKGF